MGILCKVQNLLKFHHCTTLRFPQLETKLIFFRGEAVRAKIVVVNIIIEQVKDFNYLGLHIGNTRSLDLENKFSWSMWDK
jgi:DNA-directed RNA polymerase subunit E'/Rpb7